MTIPMIVPYL